MAFQYPSANEIMTEANKIPALAYEKLCEEADSYQEAYEEKYGEGSLALAGPRTLADYLDGMKTAFDWIPGVFESFTEPDLSALEKLTDSMRAAEGSFGSGGLGLATLAMDLMGEGGWDGTFSATFRANFLATLTGPESIPDNQKKVITTLREQMEANEAIFAAVRTDALQLAKNVITALEAVGDKSSDDISMGLCVAGIVVATAGVLLAPVTGGMSVGGALAVNLTLNSVSAAITVGDKLLPEDGDIPLDADTVNGVIDNMAAAMERLWTYITTEEDKIIKVLGENHEKIIALRQAANASGYSSPIMPLRPDLAVNMNKPGLLVDRLD
ncbi:hypothetical protein Pen01_21510 [Phytomonospora endophytica]|nr:hypothetical protein Pen01_21510 [Phytomonospora endophytica]